MYDTKGITNLVDKLNTWRACEKLQLKEALPHKKDQVKLVRNGSYVVTKI